MDGVGEFEMTALHGHLTPDCVRVLCFPAPQAAEDGLQVGGRASSFNVLVVFRTSHPKSVMASAQASRFPILYVWNRVTAHRLQISQGVSVHCGGHELVD